MKPIRFSLHARLNLRDREISEEEVERALQQPEFVTPGYANREIYMRRYQDGVLAQEMLLRVIVEETETERVIVTVHKTSQIERYLKGLLK
jgi:hypothetical protein